MLTLIFLISNAKICTKFINNPLRIPFTGDTVGPELIINGDFSDGINNWILMGVGQETVVNEQLILRNSGKVRQENVVDTGKTYLGEITVSGLSTGHVDIYIGSSTSLTVNTNGTHTFAVTNPTNRTVYVYGSSIWDGYIDNISVKEQ